MPEWAKVRLGTLLRVVEDSTRGGEFVLGRSALAACAARPGQLRSELATLGDGWRVGAVVGQDLFEDVAGLVGFVGDDEEAVLQAAAGGADVETAVAGGSGDDGDADVDGVALVAVGGGRVAEPERWRGCSRPEV